MVLACAGEVGEDARMLRGEVTEFLRAVVSTSDDDWRGYERIPGSGAMAVLHVPGHSTQRVEVNDISRGGVSVRSDWWAEAGTAVDIELPGALGLVTVLTMQSEGGVLELAFHHDEVALPRIDQALAALRAQTENGTALLPNASSA